MSEMDEKRKIQKITRLLEMGGTMLANHHDCGAPLFRYQGKTLCPVCDFQEQREVRETIKKPVVQKEPAKPEIIPIKEPLAGESTQIAALIQNKIQGIASSLENETDLQRIKEKMECIELGIKILKLLES